MRTNGTLGWRQHTDRGLSLYFVAAGMVFLLGMLGLGIDLASLYVGRVQAQRAADAAALAGAQAFVDSGYTSGLGSAATAQALATERATSVGNSNLIAGVSPNLSASNISFNFSNPQDPQITVVAARDTANGNPMPTFFVKIFGINSANVSATATAEAVNVSGTGMATGSSCLKPWMYPNCDPGNSVPIGSANANPNCPDPNNPSNDLAYIIYPPPSGAIVRPGLTPTGIIGESLTIYVGTPTVPSKYMSVCIPPGTVASDCPACAIGGAGSTDSASLYRQNIECCNQAMIVCGNNTVQPINGGMAGPTKQGVDCLINEGPSGTGQDILNIGSAPFTVTAGSNNLFYPPGSTVSVGDSPSTVTLPIYDGSTLCPGGSCPATLTVDVLGFMQIFISNDTGPPAGQVSAYVLNVAGCGAGGSTGSSNTVATSASPVPVRLIHP